jgi:hypothetical protein
MISGAKKGAVPICPQCGEAATYQTPDGTFWDGYAHYWRTTTKGTPMMISDEETAREDCCGVELAENAVCFSH